MILEVEDEDSEQLCDKCHDKLSTSLFDRVRDTVGTRAAVLVFVLFGALEKAPLIIAALCVTWAPWAAITLIVCVVAWEFAAVLAWAYSWLRPSRGEP